MDEPVRPQIVRDSLTEIELVDGTRFISHPCTPVRGKPKARVYLDEMAHYKEGLDRQIYLAALPSTTKGDGYIRLGSSTAGGSGLFWEIDTGSLKDWPGFDGQRRVIYWWLVRALCTDVPTANQVAPALTTHDRVYRFGTTALIEIFENMFIEDFQQEYECAYVDEASAWISWDLIKRNQANPPHHYHARSVDEALGMIPLIQEDIQAGLIEYSLVAGIDVGRHKNLTELIVLGKTTTGQFPVRFMVSLDRVEYDDQKRCFVEIAKRLPFAGGLVDESGLGNHLAEDLHRETGGLFAGVTFTNEKKEVWAVQARVLAERGLVPLPLHRDLAYQIHSIKKKVTAAKNAVFDTERNEKHHADKFWAWALALWAGSGGISPYKTWVS
jgi:phage FluMu gp28-like protein